MCHVRDTAESRYKCDGRIKDTELLPSPEKVDGNEVDAIRGNKVLARRMVTLEEEPLHGLNVSPHAVDPGCGLQKALRAPARILWGTAAVVAVQ